MKEEDLVIVRPEGLYCPQGDFHIDPWRGVPRAVITHAHGDHARTGSQHYWGATRGLGLMRERLGKQSPITPLDYGQKLRFNEVTISLHSAGHVLGSAQVRIEHDDGRVWGVSGDFKRDADLSCDPFEPFRCDTLDHRSNLRAADLPLDRYRRGCRRNLRLVAGLQAGWPGRRAVLLLARQGAASAGRADSLH